MHRLLQLTRGTQQGLSDGSDQIHWAVIEEGTALGVINMMTFSLEAN